MSDEVVSPTIECDNCNAEIAEDEALYTENGTHVCDMCAVYCNRCDSTYDQNEGMHYVDDHLWCESCTEHSAYWCDSCNEYTEDSTFHIPDRGEYWCSSCTDYTTYCEDCGEYYADGCDECTARSVHDWSYKPDPIFHSVSSDERLFFGIEIEMEAQGIRDLQLASEYASILEQEELAYLKNDGSLDCGMELVTHPMSYDFFLEHADETLWYRLETLRTKYEMRSGDTRTCGLHIHISRSGFSGGAHMHRFLNLVYSNPLFYSVMAGRSSDRWATFDDVVSMHRDSEGNYKHFKTFKKKIMDGRSTNRYSAVNTQNQHTLEMRIFKGSMQKHTVLAQIGLAHASVEYTRTLSMRDIANGALDGARFIEYIRDNAELYPYTVARIDRKADQLQQLTTVR